MVYRTPQTSPIFSTPARASKSKSTSILLALTCRRLMCSATAMQAGSGFKALEQFIAVRPRLHYLAARVLKNFADAEDVVQEVWVRWQATNHVTIVNPEAYLSTVTTRLALNVVTSAAHRRSCQAPPQMLEQADRRTPEVAIETQEEINEALSRVLNALGPSERAAFLLHDAFEVSYSEIAQLLGKSEPAARQVVSRARRKLPAHTAVVADTVEHQRLVHAFTRASQTGDLSVLGEVLGVKDGRLPCAPPRTTNTNHRQMEETRI